MDDRNDLTLLRDLDAAPAAPLDETARRRADAALHRIVTSSPDVPGEVRVLRPHRRRALRWAAVPAAAAAVVGATWVLPGGIGAHPAYASWTPEPGVLTEADRDVADEACRDQLDDAGDGAGSPELRLAERRGEWVAVLYDVGPDLVGACLAHVPAGASEADHVTSGAATGSSGAVPGGQLTEGPMFQFGGDGGPGVGSVPQVSFTEGRVPEGVTEVIVVTPEGDEVETTLADGRYLAWWPGAAFTGDLDQPSGEGGPTPGVSYLLRTADGVQRVGVADVDGSQEFSESAGRG